MGAALTALHAEQKEDTGMCLSAYTWLGISEHLLLQLSQDLMVPWELCQKNGERNIASELGGIWLSPVFPPHPYPPIKKPYKYKLLDIKM